MNKHRIKNLRNELGLYLYLSKRAPELQNCLVQLHQQLREDDTLYVSIAFEQPQVLSWQIDLFHKYMNHGQLLVCDNSRNTLKREEIKELCRVKNIPYLPLPSNPTPHVNRSHGNAMSWIHQHVLKQLENVHVAFIDHDLLPVQPWDMSKKLMKQPCYGLRNMGKSGSWSLWAGYCAYQTGVIHKLRSNFLYDFSLELDTGGRLWQYYYQGIVNDTMSFAQSEVIAIPDHQTGIAQRIQIIDQSWLHVGGVSYSRHQEQTLQFFSKLITALLAGASWNTLVLDGLR